MRSPAQQQQPLAQPPPPSPQQFAQYPPPPQPPYYYGGNQHQYWNSYMLPSAQQQQPLGYYPPPSPQQFALYPPPPPPPYYDGGSQQQYWNSYMLSPAHQHQPLGHYPPPLHQQYYYGDGAAENVGVDEVRTLYIGCLQNWMDEGYLYWCFGPAVAGQLVSARIIRKKQSGHAGYGFLEFSSRAAAEDILQSFNGKQMPYAEQNFKLNWASPIAETFDIFVGNLDVSVTDSVLQETFKSVYPSVKSAKVKWNRAAGHSTRFGFVKFGDETEKNRSIIEMNGHHISNRHITVSDASGITASSAQPQNAASHQNPQGTSDPTNTRIYVEGIPFGVQDWDLGQVFSQFGQVVDVFILYAKCYGFVRFADRPSAERAMTGRLRNSIKIRGKTVRFSWARPRNQQNQPGPSQSG